MIATIFPRKCDISNLLGTSLGIGRQKIRTRREHDSDISNLPGTSLGIARIRNKG